MKNPMKESKDRRGAGEIFLHTLSDQFPPNTLLSRHAVGVEARSFLPPFLHHHQGWPWAFGPRSPWNSQVTLPPNCAPHLAHGLCHGAAAAPVFIVSVSCLLVLSAATLRQKPAKPANSPRRTKCRAILNSLLFWHPAPAITSSLTLSF